MSKTNQPFSEEARAAIRASAAQLTRTIVGGGIDSVCRCAEIDFTDWPSDIRAACGWCRRVDVVERELLAVQAEATAALEAEYAADPAEQRAERYALEAADLTRRLMDMEAKVAEAAAVERQRCLAHVRDLREREVDALNNPSAVQTCDLIAEAIEEGAEP